MVDVQIGKQLLTLCMWVGWGKRGRMGERERERERERKESQSAEYNEYGTQSRAQSTLCEQFQIDQP